MEQGSICVCRALTAGVAQCVSGGPASTDVAATLRPPLCRGLSLAAATVATEQLISRVCVACGLLQLEPLLGDAREGGAVQRVGRAGELLYFCGAPCCRGGLAPLPRSRGAVVIAVAVYNGDRDATRGRGCRECTESDPLLRPSTVRGRPVGDARISSRACSASAMLFPPRTTAITLCNTYTPHCACSVVCTGSCRPWVA